MADENSHNDKSPNLEVILKIGTPIFILLGVAKICAYYSVFNLQIIQFLDISEYVAIFLTTLPQIILWVFNLIVFYLYMNGKVKFYYICVLFFLLTLLVALLPLGDSKAFIEYIRIDCFVSFFFSILLLLFKINISKRAGFSAWIKKTNSINLIFYIFFCVIVGLAALKGFLEAKEVEKNKTYVGTRIYIDGKIVESTDTCYYIGKTRNYIIFYNEKKKSTITFLNNKVDKIEFVSK